MVTLSAWPLSMRQQQYVAILLIALASVILAACAGGTVALVLASATLLTWGTVQEDGSPTAPRSTAPSVLCQDALQRRRNAEEALARGPSSGESAAGWSIAQRNARTALANANTDLSRTC